MVLRRVCAYMFVCALLPEACQGETCPLSSSAGMHIEDGMRCTARRCERKILTASRHHVLSVSSGPESNRGATVTHHFMSFLLIYIYLCLFNVCTFLETCQIQIYTPSG